MKQLIYIAAVEHPSGIDFHTDTTQEGLYTKVAAHCRAHWESILDGEPRGTALPAIPEDDQACIERYFDDHPFESLHEDCSSVDVGPDLPFTQDEHLIIMEAARVALSCAKTFDGVADAMDIADPELQAVRDKLAEYLDRNAIPTDAPDHDNPVTDRRICVEEGWILADVDNTGILEIQKDDDASVFETDTEAVMFVAAKAGLGVPYHCRALEVHLKTHPTDKAIIAQATAKEIRGVATSGKVSPLMKIWVTLAHGLPEDTIVLVRIGDFFETFGSDAHKMGSLANLAVSKRMGVPMCGFPVHMLTQIKKSIGAQKIAAIDVSEGWGALWPVCTIRDIRKMVPGGYYLQLTRFDRGDPTDRDFVGNVVQALEWPDTPTGRDYRLLYMRHVDPKDLMRRRVGSVERFAVWDHEVSDPKGPIHSYYFECKMP